MIHNIEENDNDAEDNKQVANILNRIIDDANLVQQQQLKIYRLGRRTPSKIRTLKSISSRKIFVRMCFNMQGSLVTPTVTSTLCFNLT